MRHLFAFGRSVCRQAALLLQHVFGVFHWQPPGWITRIGASGRQRPRASLSGLLLISLLLGGGFAYWHWYANLPKPPEVDWSIAKPGIQAYHSSALPPVITLAFEKSVARLDLIGKAVNPQVSLTPKLAGRWTWINGAWLVFQPTAPWPADTSYRVDLKPELFSPRAHLAKYSDTFRTPPFAVTISEPLFYVSPANPQDKAITATLLFNYPVDRASLESSISLVMQGNEDIFKDSQGPASHVTLTFAADPFTPNRKVYVRSTEIAIPTQAGFARLTVPTSVRTTAGSASLDEPQDVEVRVPDLSNLFTFTTAQAIIDRDKFDEPSQTLVLSSSIGVKDDVLNRAIHAYLLPKYKEPVDATQADAPPTQWASPAEVDAPVRKRLQPVSLTPLPSEVLWSGIHRFRMEVPEGMYLYVEVDPGIAAIGGFTLAHKFDSVLAAPVFPRQVKIISQGSLLALTGERKLSISSSGVDQLEYQLSRVLPAQLNNLVSQTEGAFPQPRFINWMLDESNISELITRRADILLQSRTKMNYSALDFSEFVDDRDQNQGKLGLFLLRVLARKKGPGGEVGYFHQNGDLLPQKAYEEMRREDQATDDVLGDKRLILLTDMGLIVKDNQDGTHDVFVVSIKSGEPVEDARVDVIGKNGVPVATAQTNDQGRASLPNLDDFVREARPVAYVVHHESDVSFLPFGREDRELNFTRFDTGGVYGIKPGDLSALVFTDRGIYRPGDAINFGLIVKQHDWGGNLAGLPLSLEITDPRDQPVQTRTLRLGASGLLDANFASRETSLTGTYQARCYLVRGKNDKIILGNTSFKIREFLPDRLKLVNQLSKPVTAGWLSIDDLKAKITLRNLYGAPAIGHRVGGTLSITPTSFQFEQFPGYTFADPNYREGYLGKDIKLPDETTDENGAAQFDLSQQGFAPMATQISFLAEGFEKEGGRSVKAVTGALISPRPWLLGVKPDGDFSFLPRGSKHTASFLGLNAQLEPLALPAIRLERVRRDYISTLVQKENGNYAYQTTTHDVPQPDETITPGIAGFAWPLPTEAPGEFLVTAYDQQGAKLATLSYTVAGAGNSGQKLDKNAELSVKLSKTEYLPGEEIEVQITAPYTGAGLITIERDHVFASTWFQTKTTATVQKIKIPRDMEGNGYLNVSFVRALDSKEIYLSPLSYAAVPFKISREARRTLLQIEAPKLALPGQPLTFRVAASRSTQGFVYLVDEGILQVAGYEKPDPLGFFFPKQALEVGTRQTVDLLLPEYSIAREVAATGGDEGRDLLAHHLNPFKRKHDAAVVYWSGVVDLGPQAKAFTYQVPDYFAGTLRVMVVAASPEAVGATQTKLQVRGPFVISPNVPTFVAPGDTFDLSVTVANNIAGSKKYAAIDLELLTTANLEVLHAPASPQVIAENRDASVHWLLRARDLLGNADLDVVARYRDQTSHLVSHLSIRPPVPYLTTVQSGYFTADQKQIDLPRRLYPQFFEGKAMASVLPQGLSRGLSTYLEHYEYGCTEQLISKAFPSLVSSDTQTQGLTPAEVQAHLNEVFTVAATRQNDAGAFCLWYVEPDVMFDLPSVWVVHLLTEAKERGYEIPDDLLTRGLTHLEKIAESDPPDFYAARVQTYAIYLLTLNGQITTNYLEHNREWFTKNSPGWEEDVSGPLMAATYARLKDETQANALIAKFHFAGPTVQYGYDFYSELSRDGLALQLITHEFPERLHRLTPDDLTAITRPIMNGDFNSFSAAQAVLGLDEYARATGHDSALGTLSIDQLIDKTARPLQLEEATTLHPEGPFQADAHAIIFHKPERNRIGLPGLFYQVSQAGFEHEAVTTPLNEGIEVTREYRNENKEVVTQARLGDELTVRLLVRAVGYDDLSNVAVVDLLPGGFEIVPESIQTGHCFYDGIDYSDVREDRALFFGTIHGSETEITYKIKATNKGTYIIPPPQAEAMYQQKIRSRGVSARFTVGD